MSPSKGEGLRWLGVILQVTITSPACLVTSSSTPAAVHDDWKTWHFLASSKRKTAVNSVCHKSSRFRFIPLQLSPICSAQFKSTCFECRLSLKHETGMKSTLNICAHWQHRAFQFYSLEFVGSWISGRKRSASVLPNHPRTTSNNYGKLIAPCSVQWNGLLPFSSSFPHPAGTMTSHDNMLTAYYIIT